MTTNNTCVFCGKEATETVQIGGSKHWICDSSSCGCESDQANKEEHYYQSAEEAEREDYNRYH